MNEIWAAYAAAFALGAAHALEVDHMVAVSAFVGGTPRVAQAVGFGVRWGLGHSAVVLVAGTLLAWSGLAFPASAEVVLESVVGGALIGVGAWTFRNARRLHVHTPAEHGGHGHLHSHREERTPHPHDHGAVRGRHAHLPTIVGVIHGLAGTAPVVALVPVTLLPSLAGAVTYLAAFGAGTVLGMGAYAGVAAMAAGRAAESVRSARVLAYGTALLSIVVGVWWLGRVLAE